MSRQPAFRPALEMLEERCAPAVLTVNSLADNTTADSSLTLREAIQIVDGNLGRALTSAEQVLVSGTVGTSNTIQFTLPAGAADDHVDGQHAVDHQAGDDPAHPGASLLTISGNNANRVFVVGTNSSQSLSLNVAISGLTVTGGSNSYGAGILNYANLTISNCAIIDNAAGTSGGGGIYDVGVLALINSTIANNTVSTNTSGAGLHCTSAATATITNCSFTGNNAGGSGSNASSGGGISNSGALTISASTFVNNVADSDGGGIYSDGNLTVANSTFNGNSALSDGGAIRSGNSSTSKTLSLTGCTFNANTSSSEGGGVDATYSGTVAITNCTFTANVGGSQGGAFRFDGINATLTNDTITGNRVPNGNGNRFGGGIYDLGQITLNNTIVAGNFQGEGTPQRHLRPAQCSQLLQSHRRPRRQTAWSTASTATRSASRTSDLRRLYANNGGPTLTIPLLPGSPAIDKGSNAFVAAGETDQRGLPRIVNGAVDIGAYEVQMSSLAASFTVTGFPTSIQAGAVAAITVTARDASGNIVTGYLGAVHFTSSDPQAVLPADYVFVSGDNGVHTFNVTLKTAGTQSLNVNDAFNSTVTGAEAGIVVAPAALTGLLVSPLPATVTAGTPIPFTVTAVDAFGNLASGYTGMVHFTSTDPRASLPVDSTLTNGVGTFNVTLKTAGSQTLTAADTVTSSLTGHSGPVTVSAAAAASFVLNAPATATAGVPFSFSVTAKDPFGNLASGYAGTIHFTSSDALASLPTDSTLMSGVGAFRATLRSTGSQSLIAADTVAPTLTGTQIGIVVTPAVASTFTVSGFASPATAGTPATFTVTARDTLGNVATGYLGTVHFTSSDPQAVLPADYTFVSGDNGVHTFTATLKTAGAQSLTATDKSAAVMGTQTGITVTPAAVNALIVAGVPSPIQIGVSAGFTVTADDIYGNVVTGYLGAVHFTSSDPQAVLPADYPFVSGDQGIHAFKAAFATIGNQSLTATDSVNALTGAQTSIAVVPVNGAVLTVNSVADNTTADNVLTLREAIAIEDGTLGRALTAGEQAQIVGTPGGAHDVIQFNLPAGPQTITLSAGALSLTHSLTITGPGAGNLTINGNNSDRDFIVGQIWSPNLSLVVAISGLTIAGGSQVYGGGLLNFGTLTVTNTTFTGNTAASSGGGALYNVGALTLNACTFTGNAISSVGAGGGIENISSGTVSITNCVFTGNTANGSGSTASSGAAIANSGVITIAASSFTGNTAASDGGAHLPSDATLAISNCSFLNNTALSDGGAIRSDGVLSVTASTFAGNSAASVGGGLDSSDTMLALTNCTFANNIAVSQGGAIMADAGSGTANLTNDTIAANRVTIGSGGTLRRRPPPAAAR